MKKLLTGLILSIVFGAISMAAAQTTGVNNNSDWKVPVTTPSLPQGGSGAAAASAAVAAAAAASAVPPPVVTIVVPASFTLAVGNLNDAGITPVLPTNPTPVPVPSPVTVAAASATAGPVAASIVTLPATSGIPTLAPITTSPSLRLVAPTGTTANGQANSEKEK